MPDVSGYAENEPLGAYALIAGVWTTAFAVGLGAAAKRRVLPGRMELQDVALLGLATHKISRLLTKDSVTSFARAPFVKLEEKSGTNSIEETPRGNGLQRAIGELVSCPECMDHWVASGLVVSLLHAPRTTRTLCGLYSGLAVADLMQYVFAGLKSRA